MNILFIKHFFIGFMVSEILRVSVFGHCLYSVISPMCIVTFILRSSDFIVLIYVYFNCT